MKIILIGPQGSGKGTQAAILSKRIGIPHISTGELLRNLPQNLKKKTDSFVKKGLLIPDELMLQILKSRLSKPDCKSGFILDGFPRNLKQATLLDELTSIDRVLYLSIPDEIAIKRLSHRLVCPKCGTNYNELTNPKPKRKGMCDYCNIPLTKRKDDTEEAIRQRLKIYHQQTEELISYYKNKNKLIEIDATKNIPAIANEILEKLQK